MHNKDKNKDIEKRVIELRKKGYSRNRISEELHLGHSTVQEILKKHNLTAKQGYDVRKKRHAHKKRKGKVKGKKSIVKKPEKEKVVKKYRKFIYAYIKYKGYKGMFLERGEYGTRYTEYYDEYELMDVINLTRSYAIYEMAGICQSLSSIKFDVYYIRVLYDKDKKKIVSKESIRYEHYTCNDLRGLIYDARMG